MNNSGYWENIKSALNTSVKGLKTTIKHFKDAKKTVKPMSVSDPNYFTRQEGIMTLQYPHESLPIPDNGRYKLHNEIDDCIVCDKCAKICPVDCIDIEPIKAKETFGYTSDGTPKRIYAAKFDIDMGKCCFCGLCTTVCPTECLTMTKSFDFSEYDIADHTYEFATMTPLEILEKKKEIEEFEKAKKTDEVSSTKKKMAVKPVVKKKEEESNKPKPKFKPRPMIKKKKKDDE
ncbi:4Fe-4S dicluster domain-containing protein [Fulvivirga lutea]|uniref:4Fe-4S dicluster domain-containing protein n=1 Tax=Fulvivirga lutea TaxID=2810512 RepID=A0A974WIF9_9BACT|nr:4Fe-4S dicluster domain-containing protein [Fulvivirga lutea]QSE95943.1 4Fe-4S dicluster domain-containing protein [Fulvivirga lutea]